MKVIVSSGDKHVHIYVKGSSAKGLKRAERTAQKLLAKAVTPVKEKNPIGFAAPKDAE